MFNFKRKAQASAGDIFLRSSYRTFRKSVLNEQ